MYESNLILLTPSRCPKVKYCLYLEEFLFVFDARLLFSVSRDSQLLIRCLSLDSRDKDIRKKKGGQKLKLETLTVKNCLF